MIPTKKELLITGILLVATMLFAGCSGTFDPGGTEDGATQTTQSSGGGGLGGLLGGAGGDMGPPPEGGDGPGGPGGPPGG